MSLKKTKFSAAQRKLVLKSNGHLE